jgi:hypothetical protein
MTLDRVAGTGLVVVLPDTQEAVAEPMRTPGEMRCAVLFVGAQPSCTITNVRS